MIQSMNRPGHSEDNNHMESFFGSLKAEKIHGATFTDERQLRKSLRNYIERFYNEKRRHSGLDYRSPADYETMAVNIVSTKAGEGPAPKRAAQQYVRLLRWDDADTHRPVPGHRLRRERTRFRLQVTG